MNKQKMIELFLTQYTHMKKNCFAPLDRPEEAMWEKPLIGFASGSDPLFVWLKKDIGDFYSLPGYYLLYPGKLLR